VNEQTEQIERVGDAIASHVSAFVTANMEREFHVEDLRRYVYDHVAGYVSPDSPGRILRDLRQQGRVNYVVVSRAKSLYKALPMVGQLELF